VHVKIAQSADGFIAPPRGRRVWISSTASRRLVHEWRALYDAVLVGAGTVKADDPFLTVRSTPGRNPHAVILDGGFSVPKAARLFKTRSGRRVIVVTTSSALGRTRSKAVELAARGVEVLGIRTRSKRIPFDLLLRVLYGERIGSLLVEGGAEVFGQVLRERAADEISTFIAPRELGEGVAVAHPRHGGVGRRRTGGKDVRVTARMSGVDLLISARRR
jgi:diaminohydroxyphosphoribosylaminopyrimidine deaminase/5-amino-6-(5-phosphoribosylamino)uracil reductase